MEQAAHENIFSLKILKRFFCWDANVYQQKRENIMLAKLMNVKVFEVNAFDTLHIKTFLISNVIYQE